MIKVSQNDAFNRPVEETGLFDYDNKLYHISFNYQVKSKFKGVFSWNLGTEKIIHYKYSGKITRITIYDNDFKEEIEHLKRIFQKSVKLINAFVESHEFAKYCSNHVMILESFRYRIGQLSGEIDGR